MFWFQDFRYALRTLWHAKSFTLVTVGTLALAIGLNSTIFSMVSLLLVGDLPIGDPDRTAFLRTENPARGVVRQDFTAEDYVTLRRMMDDEEVRSFQNASALSFDTRILGGAGIGEARRVPVGLLSPSFFDTWEITAAHGRGFTADEGEFGGDRVVMLAHGLWQREYGGDPDILDSTLVIDGYETTIVGIMDPALEFGDMGRFERWMPLVIDPATADATRREIFVTARLADGSTFERAQQEIDALAARQAERFPDSHRGWTMRVKPARDDLADDAFLTVMALLSITVLGVLLVACSNVATLTLARSAERSRELAVRSALGAGRLRILRQLLTESLLISFFAAGLGLVVTAASQRGLLWIAGDGSGIIYFLRTMKVDHTVLFFTLALAVAAPLAFGLVPAIHAARRDLRTSLQEGGRTGGGRKELRGRRWLVGGQVAVALSLMLLVGALVHSLREQRRLDPGYDKEAIVSARIDLPEIRYHDDASRRDFARLALAELESRPDVELAAWTSRMPMDPGGYSNLTIEGRDQPGADDEQPWATVSAVSPDFLAILGVSLQRGRGFEPSDDPSGRRVALVNQEAAALWWPDGDSDDDPIGARFHLPGQADQPLEIVGVVGDLQRPSLVRPVEPEVYLPLAQNPQADLALLVRGRMDDATAVVPSLRAVFSQLDPTLPVAEVRTLQQSFEDAWATSLTIESLLGSFAFFALLMAAAGIYGVASYAVARRRREMGIRMALGAKRSEIGLLVLRQTAGILVVGGALGLLGGWGLTSFLAAGLGGIAKIDTVAWAGVTMVLLAVAFVATALPARRATKVDPSVALRDE